MKKIYVDLGNKNYKAIYEDKKIISSSNVELVPAGTYGSWEVDGVKSYLIGECAKSKRSTNKIVEEKRVLLGRELFSIVEDKDKIEVVTLLPLSLYVNVENKQKYMDLLKGKYKVTNSNGVSKTFTVTNVSVNAESFSSLITEKSLLTNVIFLTDIGGVDTTICEVNKVPNPNKLHTSECGMNIFFNGLAKVLTSKLLESYSDKDAELVFNKYDNLDDELKTIIDSFAEGYIQKNIYEPLKELGYKSLIHKIVCTGGGAKALERYLSKDSNVKILNNALFSNVEGAKILDTMRGGK